MSNLYNGMILRVIQRYSFYLILMIVISIERKVNAVISRIYSFYWATEQAIPILPHHNHQISSSFVEVGSQNNENTETGE